MYKQSDQKEQLFNAIQDFHHEFINENLMISHKMLGENHQHDLNNLFELFSKSFDFNGMEIVSEQSFTEFLICVFNVISFIVSKYRHI